QGSSKASTVAEGRGSTDFWQAQRPAAGGSVSFWREVHGKTSKLDAYAIRPRESGPMKPASEFAALSGHRPLTFAHLRGAGLWPENTLEAFRSEIALGCSHLETDLRLSRDG